MVRRLPRRAARCGRSRSTRSSASLPSRPDDCDLPILRRPARDGVRRPRHVAAGELLPAPERWQRAWSRSIRCTRRSAASACSCSSRSSRRRSEIFCDYAYFSSYSSSWLEHAERYVEMMVERFGLGGGQPGRRDRENDGYLLQYFVAARHAGARHRAGRERRRGGATSAGVRHARRVLRRRDRARVVASDRQADLLLGNNVLAHVPDLNDFVGGHEDPARADGGVITMEFPHLLRLIEREPVRHDLPRALLVLLVPRPSRGSSRATACGCSTSRRCRPTAARCASTAPRRRRREAD